MTNMSYCRFRNTVQDLKDCYFAIEDRDLSQDENEARKQLIELCRKITAQFEGEDDLDEAFEDNEKEQEAN